MPPPEKKALLDNLDSGVDTLDVLDCDDAVFFYFLHSLGNDVADGETWSIWFAFPITHPFLKYSPLLYDVFDVNSALLRWFGNILMIKNIVYV